MKMEHIGIQVKDAEEVARWYCENLGFTVKRSVDGDAPVRFIADSGGAILFEMYHNPNVLLPDYASMDPMVLHFAFNCADVPATVGALVEAGASLVKAPITTEAGDELAMLRDPWGLPIQLANRKSALN
jgi:catechol 2,3-dioxygenase-like lactoylglutathione lyase family enzyme